MTPTADDFLPRNQQHWGSRTESETALADRAWAASDVRWGCFHALDDQVGLIQGVQDKDVLEIGSGTGYVSAYVLRRGGRPVAIDPTEGQLRITAAKQAEYEEFFPLIQARGERLPLADSSFDLAISEYGAAIWADPYRWIPEAARVLRPGGELRFLGNHPLLMACMPLDGSVPALDRLQRPWNDMYRFDWPEVDVPAGDIRPAHTEPSVTEFHLPPGAMIRLLRASGFEVLDFIELTAPADSVTSYDFVTPQWARTWPHEEVWKARLLPVT
ncbi:MAG: class I SAM-dependent methyltransferase [Euzebya sp.]